MITIKDLVRPFLRDVRLYRTHAEVSIHFLINLNLFFFTFEFLPRTKQAAHKKYTCTVPLITTYANSNSINNIASILKLRNHGRKTLVKRTNDRIQRIGKDLTPSQRRIITFESYTTRPLLMRPILIPYSSVDTISPPSQSDSHV